MRDETGGTPLIVASRLHRPHLVQLVLHHAADPSARDAMGMTPLMTTAESGSIDIVEKQLTKRADVDAASYHGDTAIKLAAADSRRDTVTLLKRSGATTQAVASSQR